MKEVEWSHFHIEKYKAGSEKDVPLKSRIVGEQRLPPTL